MRVQRQTLAGLNRQNFKLRRQMQELVALREVVARYTTSSSQQLTRVRPHRLLGNGASTGSVAR